MTTATTTCAWCGASDDTVEPVSYRYPDGSVVNEPMCRACRERVLTRTKVRQRVVAPAAPGLSRSRRRRFRLSRLPRPTPPVLALLVVGLVLVGGAMLGVRTLGKVRQDVTAARSELEAVTNDPLALTSAGGRSAARVRVARAQALMVRAHERLKDSRVLAVAGALPGVRGQRDGAIGLVGDARTVTDVARRLLDVVDALAARERVRDGVVPLAALRTLEGEVSAAARTVGRLRERTGLWGGLGEAAEGFEELRAPTSRRLRLAADALGATRTFLGGDGPRTYFVGAQNNAEMRDQGAMLSYAVLVADGGRLRVERHGPTSELRPQQVDVDVAPGTRQLFGDYGIGRAWPAVNATPDFATTGRLVEAMYDKAAGTAIDGVVGIDVPALAMLLRAVGPVSLPGIEEPVTADNVAQILLKRQYDGLPSIAMIRAGRANASQEAGRKERLGELVDVLVSKLTTGEHDVVVLARALADAAAGRHLRVWSRTATEQRTFESVALAGGPAAGSDVPTFHVAAQNVTATKLDFFVRTKLRVEVDVTASGTAVVRSAYTVRNFAPAAPESAQLGPDGVTSKAPGVYVSRTYLWGPAGASQAGSIEESGMRVTEHDLTVGPGQEATARFETAVYGAVRDGALRLRFVPQPRHVPAELEVVLQAPGWRITGSPTVGASWSRDITLRWFLTR